MISVSAIKKDTGDDTNYCYQTEKMFYAYGRLVNMVGWAVVDTFIASAATRLGPWGLPLAAGAQFATGSASIIVDQGLEDKSVLMWPGE